MDFEPYNATVVLRDQEDRDGTRYLDATIDKNGRLVFEGQDVGAGVEHAFGEGYREYEWRWTVNADDIPAAIEALGGAPGEPPLAVAVRWIEQHGTDPGSALKAARVRTEFWSRLGD
ncbi:MAG TPA: hypothetical protein VES19_10415 [Candidatus Limnocylindrales bacterium]|nr:hypothetical protein [Candidatus Limnocylindrales bacterium]